jgi:hypothetical protein
MLANLSEKYDLFCYYAPIAIHYFGYVLVAYACLLLRKEICWPINRLVKLIVDLDQSFIVVPKFKRKRIFYNRYRRSPVVFVAPKVRIKRVFIRACAA